MGLDRDVWMRCEWVWLGMSGWGVNGLARAIWMKCEWVWLEISGWGMNGFG